MKVVEIHSNVDATYPACSLNRSHRTSTQEVVALDEAHTTLLDAALAPKGPLMWMVGWKSDFDIDKVPSRLKLYAKLRLMYLLPSQWELIVKYGYLLTETLKAEGYDARLVIDTTLPAIQGVVVVIPVEGWDTDITIMYCHRYLHSPRTIPEYLVQVDRTTWYIIGLEHVLDRLSNMMLYRQCISCHYGSDRMDDVYHCGLGLMLTSGGECSHYMGRAPHNQYTQEI